MTFKFSAQEIVEILIDRLQEKGMAEREVKHFKALWTTGFKVGDITVEISEREEDT